MHIRDIPKIKSLLEETEMFKSFKTVFPALKPFLRLVGVDTSSIEDALETVDELAEQIDESPEITQALAGAKARTGKR